MASSPTDELATVRSLRHRNEALLKENQALKAGDGGGTSGGMESRVAKLEAHVEILRNDVTSIKKDVGDIRVAMATLTERVSHLATKGFIVTATTTTIGLLTGIILFSDKIKALFAAS